MLVTSALLWTTVALPATSAGRLVIQDPYRLSAACELWIDFLDPDYRYVKWSQADAEVSITFEKPVDLIEVRCKFRSPSDQLPVVTELEVNGLRQSALEVSRLNQRIRAADPDP